jgi:hypothetical protein
MLRFIFAKYFAEGSFYLFMYRMRATITRILQKKQLEKLFLTSKKWVEKIQTAGYNGAGTVCILNG